jgi:phosphoglycerol transferase MdoB-like AlkP superfamily enzyme
MLLLLLMPVAMNGLLRPLLSGYFLLALMLLLGMEAIGVGFLAEYDHRPEQLFWDYLIYPGEVSAMLWGDFKVEGAFVLGCLGLGVVLARRHVLPKLQHLPPTSVLARGCAALVLCVLCFIAIRSGFGHRPANISTAVFSTNRLANELALSSAYTAAYARLAQRHHIASSDLYGSIPIAEAARRVAKMGGFPALETLEDWPTAHPFEASVQVAAPRNLVVILEESLGAQFVGSLGGRNLTPELDRLSEQGVFFTQLYATGTRTVRGIEAVLTGFPPSAARSVVKRNKSRRNFFTMASLLSSQGYSNYFIYGGQPNFDDMGSFMYGNGFDEVVAGDDFSEASFMGAWGASDEDWARKAHETFEQAAQEGPFFGLMLSTSNHTPWDFPDGRIEITEPPKASRDNAVRYSDFALGEFFRMAKGSAYFANTVFLVVADHDARVSGEEFVPIKHFRVPGLLIAPGLEPRRYDRIASHIDLAPTILPMLGFAASTPLMGQDLIAQESKGPGRALMQYGLNNALLVGEKAVIHMPDQPAQHYIYRDGKLSLAARDESLERDALAYLGLADYLYENRLYY